MQFSFHLGFRVCFISANKSGGVFTTMSNIADGTYSDSINLTHPAWIDNFV